MSSAVEIVVTPLVAPSLPSLLPLLPTLATAGATIGVCAAAYGTYVAIDRLRKGYQTALKEFAADSDAGEQARQSLAHDQQLAAVMAAATAELTQVSAVEDAGTAFLRHRLRVLAEQSSSLPDQDLPLQCLTLLRTIEESPTNITAHLTAYHQLTQALIAARVANPSESAVDEELAALREEIQSPLLTTQKRVGTQRLLLNQLEKLQLLKARQPHLALQGIKLLRERMHREAGLQAERRDAQRKAAEEMQLLIANCHARLTAVSELPDLPDQAAHAVALFHQLNAALARASTRNLGELRQLTQQADTLFTECERLLQERLVATYISDQVATVLQELDYQVTEVAPDNAQHATLLAKVDNDVAIELRVQGNGKLTTEMVALSEDASRQGQTSQEKVCAVVDQLVSELAKRQCKVRERFRTSLTDGEMLRVVEAPPEEESIITQKTPKQQRMESQS